MLFAVIWWFPKSPRWLLKVGREDEARYILGRLRGNTGTDAELAEAEFQDIKNVSTLEKTTAHSTVNVHWCWDWQAAHKPASAAGYLVADYARMDQNCRCYDL